MQRRQSGGQLKARPRTFSFSSKQFNTLLPNFRELARRKQAVKRHAFTATLMLSSVLGEIGKYNLFLSTPTPPTAVYLCIGRGSEDSIKRT